MPPRADNENFRIANRIASPENNELRGEDDEVLQLEAKPMAVLVELARHTGQLQARATLLEAVWGDAFVGDEVLTHCIWELRRALGDQAKDPQFIQTIPRKGYKLIQLIAPVSWIGNTPDEAPREKIGEQIGAGALDGPRQ